MVATTAGILLAHIAIPFSADNAAYKNVSNIKKCWR